MFNNSSNYIIILEFLFLTTIFYINIKLKFLKCNNNKKKIEILVNYFYFF